MRAVNLIPADQRGGSSVGVGRSEGGAYALLALAAGIAAMALLYGIAHRQVTTRKAQADTLQAKAQAAQTAADQLAPYTSFVALRQQRAQAVATLVDSRFDWAHAFHEFGRVLPASASITSITGAVGAVGKEAKEATAGSAGSVSSATPPGSVPTFTVSGCATSQQAVAQTINRLRLIDGVGSVTLQSSTKSGGAGAAGGGGCPGSSPAFAMTIAFQPLPAAGAADSTATTVAASGSAATAAGASKSAGSLR